MWISHSYTDWIYLQIWKNCWTLEGEASCHLLQVGKYRLFGNWGTSAFNGWLPWSSQCRNSVKSIYTSSTHILTRSLKFFAARILQQHLEQIWNCWTRFVENVSFAKGYPTHFVDSAWRCLIKITFSTNAFVWTIRTLIQEQFSTLLTVTQNILLLVFLMEELQRTFRRNYCAFGLTCT